MKTLYEENKEHLKELIEMQKLQQNKVAELLGVNRTTVQKWCKLFGIKTQRTGPRSGAGHPCWKGGKYLVGRYWYVYSPDHPYTTKRHGVAEHRLVMEKKLGRYLDPSEVVHHVDGDGSNNHPDNLVVFQTNADHLRFELNGKIPNWTPEGKERIAQGVLKAAETHRRLKRDDDRRTQSSVRQT